MFRTAICTSTPPRHTQFPLSRCLDRNGDLDIKQLFTIEDVTDAAIEHQTFVKEDLAGLQEMLEGAEPIIDIGQQCSKPYPCDFKDHCWQHVPETSVLNFFNMIAVSRQLNPDTRCLKLSRSLVALACQRGVYHECQKLLPRSSSIY